MFLALTVIAVVPKVYAWQDGSWESKAPLPQKQIGSINAVAVNSKIYFFGSYATYMYEPVAENWTQKTTMPTSRISYAIAAVDNKVYVIGGEEYRSGQANLLSAVNEVYDVATDTWETKQPLPQPRTSMDANVVDGKIHVIGGDTMNTSNLHEVYDPATDTWTNRTLAYNLKSYISCVTDSKIYVVSAASNLFIYEAKNDSWSTGASLPKIYSEMGIFFDSPSIAATTGSYAPKRIFVMGGRYMPEFADTHAVNFTYFYDPETEKWSSAADMPTARFGFAVAVLDDKIYAIGGGVSSQIITGTDTDVVEVYTPFGYGTVQPEPEPEQEPFPTAAVIVASGAAVTLLGVGSLVYLKKRKS